jgi:hypothetical protein
MLLGYDMLAGKISKSIAVHPLQRAGAPSRPELWKNVYSRLGTLSDTFCSFALVPQVQLIAELDQLQTPQDAVPARDNIDGRVSDSFSGLSNLAS